jgi:probable rRNA maturation factor
MAVLVTTAGRAPRLAQTAQMLSGYADDMLRALGLASAELSLLVCDDAKMRVLNRDHRKLDKPTDVLAFAMGEGLALASPRVVLGDIAIALPTSERQAREHGWPVHVELCLLLAHGLLHLLGFDHRDRTEERRMMARAHLLMMAALPRTRGVDKLRSFRRFAARRSGSRLRSGAKKH